MVDIEKKMKDLQKEFNYCNKKIKEIKTIIQDEGMTIESKANGSVAHPAVKIYDTLVKNKISINKQLIDLSMKIDNIEEDDDDIDLV